MGESEMLTRYNLFSCFDKRSDDTFSGDDGTYTFKIMQIFGYCYVSIPGP